MGHLYRILASSIGLQSHFFDHCCISRPSGKWNGRFHHLHARFVRGRDIRKGIYRVYHRLRFPIRFGDRFNREFARGCRLTCWLWWLLYRRLGPDLESRPVWTFTPPLRSKLFNSPKRAQQLYIVCLSAMLAQILSFPISSTKLLDAFHDLLQISNIYQYHYSFS